MPVVVRNGSSRPTGWQFAWQDQLFLRRHGLYVRRQFYRLHVDGRLVPGNHGLQSWRQMLLPDETGAAAPHRSRSDEAETRHRHTSNPGALIGTAAALSNDFHRDTIHILEINMSLRLVPIAVVYLLWSATAQAAQPGGNSPSGSNFSCDGTICSCDKSYIDCKAMQPYCKDGDVNCGGNICVCQMKPPIVVLGRPAKPRPGTPARIQPTAPAKQQ